MLDAPTSPGKTLPAATTIGADLRRSVTADPDAATAAALRMVGDLDIQLARIGDRWRLYLQDVLPVPHTTRDVWAAAVGAAAVGATSVEWDQTPDGCLVWCEWREPAP
jgi:hypothetical protein